MNSFIGSRLAATIAFTVLAFYSAGVAAVARPKIGLALSGGGARGAAHIGVLKVLEEHNIPIDCIAGSSMGAIVGGLYASGMTIEELESAITRIDWIDAFTDKIPREDRSFRRKRDDDLYLVENKPGLSSSGLQFPAGLLDGQKIDLLLKRYTLPVVTIRDFDDLSIPYRAVTTDLETGKVVVIERGDLALAMRTSMSIPVLFAPREIDSLLLVDGGVSSNLPIDVVRRMGADVVIAIDISTPNLERDQLNSVLSVTTQISNILTRRNTDEQIASLAGGDVFIQPDLGDITVASFDRAEDAIPIGEAAAESILVELERYSVSDSDYRSHLAGRERNTKRLIIDEVRVVNDSRISDHVITGLMNVEAGESFDVDQLEKDIGQIYGLEIFESVYYDIADESGRTVLTVAARERSWGPNYLQFGVAVFEDYEGPNFNLAAAYTRTAVNRLNGEWRTGLQIGREPGLFTEFYQPIDYKLRNFVHVMGFVGEWAMNVFDSDGRKVAELGFRDYGVAAAVGRELGRWGEIRAGVIRGAGRAEVQVGDPAISGSDYQTGEAYLQFYVDELDDVSFPRAGGTFRIRITAGLDELGSDAEYEQGYVEGSYAHTMGRYTGLVNGFFGGTWNGDAPLEKEYRLGGFTRLSGLEESELNGQYSALLAATFYRRMGDFVLVPIYAGASVEYGNVFQEESEIKFNDMIAAGSIFVGFDTFIGPIYVAFGHAEGGRNNFYLFMGQSIRNRRVWFRN
jgi:NTE family protein